jgi:lycopene beta-cyclase
MPTAETASGAGACAGAAVETPAYDFALVGGGLANGLIALALLAARPGLRLALVERAAVPGGNHTWCFHAGDVPEAARAWVEPLVAHRWPGYDVIFPGRSRRLASPYAAITSERFRQVLLERFAAAPGARLLLGREAKRVAARAIELDDGEILAARAVVDARGPEQAAAVPGGAGYQKFVGLELRLARPHGLELPLLMDATVPQHEGFRFFYALPLGPERLLLEDTYVTDSPRLERAALVAECHAYARRRGWEVVQVLREEAGVLPLPLGGSLADPAQGPLLAGYQGGWLHPVTGYSFPIALRLALCLAADLQAAPAAGVPAPGGFGPRLAALRAALEPQLRYAHLLNRMFFRWYPPARRYHVLDRFYRLPEPLIRRFYALALTRADRARILVGRPPVGLSLRRMLRGWRSA